MGGKPEIPDDLESETENHNARVNTQIDAQVNAQVNDRANHRAGTWMIVGTWVLLLGMLTWFGHRWYEKNFNPNQVVETNSTGGKLSVQLEANRRGHYIASGAINGIDVVFLLDTGATGVSIPKSVAAKLALTTLDQAIAVTANGSVVVDRVELATVSVGALTRRNVRGSVNPHMEGDEVLLGMSYLRHFDLSQRGNQLTVAEP